MRTDAIAATCEKCTPSAVPPGSGVRNSARASLLEADDALVGATVTLASRHAAGTVRIDGILGEGGIGVVYGGRWMRDAELGGPARRVAIKALHPRHARDAGLARRLEREGEHLERIRHPNVVEGLGSGTLPDGRSFVAMERLVGTTLGDRVRAEGPLSIARALTFAGDLLDGLAAVHDAGLVHRDLSPDNVVVDGASRAVLVDLGFAEPPGVDAGDGTSPDSPGSLVGTLRFMAPEQATRARAITAKSDLFAAGLLLFYALTGTLPFRGRDDLDVLVSVLRAQPVPLRRERRDAPPLLERLLARALAKHPDARFASAREMRAALAEVPVRDTSRLARRVRSPA